MVRQGDQEYTAQGQCRAQTTSDARNDHQSYDKAHHEHNSNDHSFIKKQPHSQGDAKSGLCVRVHSQPLRQISLRTDQLFIGKGPRHSMAEDCSIASGAISTKVEARLAYQESTITQSNGFLRTFSNCTRRLLLLRLGSDSRVHCSIRPYVLSQRPSIHCTYLRIRY